MRIVDLISRRTSRQVSQLVIVGLGAASQGALGVDYLIKLKPSDDHTFKALTRSVVDTLDRETTTVTDAHPPGRLIKIAIDDRGEKSVSANALVQIAADPRVEYVVPTFRVHAIGTPNDPRISEQWSLPKINASRAWDYTVGSRNVTVAVIDTGVDRNHPDLAANMWRNTNEIAGNGIDDDHNGYIDDINGWDFNGNDNDPMDETGAQNPGHGTHCSGIMGAVGNNAVGISGGAQQVSIMAVRFLGADGSGDDLGAVKSIDYAVATGAQVISASWGGRSSEAEAQPIAEAIQRAHDKGVIFVVAAGNDGVSNDSVGFYPANTRLPNVINVAASDSADGKPQWSNFGTESVHLASPGLDIMSTLPRNTYGKLSGTSMATPLVAGVVALLKSVNPSLDGATARSILQASGRQVGIETACNCRIDAAAAIERLRASQFTVVPQTLTLRPTETSMFGAFGGHGPFTFESTNPATATIDSAGVLTATAIGETTVKVADASGTVAESMTVRVAEASTGGGADECPFDDPQMCQLMCAIQPTLPWCQ